MSRAMPSISGMGVAQQRELPKYTHGMPHPPIPYFGKKTKAASIVWKRLGRVHTFIDPCCGSIAVPLLSPYGAPHREVLNDVLGHVCNFHRALRDYPARTARAADRPTVHQDLGAATELLRDAEGALTDKLFDDLSWSDPEIAGLWAWAVCVSIGLGSSLSAGYESLQRYTPLELPEGPYAPRRQPIDEPAVDEEVSPVFDGKRLLPWFDAISQRIRRTYITSKDWSTLFSPAVLDLDHGGHRIAGIFFDPPYAGKEGVYAQGGDIAHDVFEWAVAHGDDPRFRICLAGYGDDYDAFPEGWTLETWTRQTGMEATAGERYDQASAMASRQESLWFSPHCLSATQGLLV